MGKRQTKSRFGPSAAAGGSGGRPGLSAESGRPYAQSRDPGHPTGPSWPRPPSRPSTSPRIGSPSFSGPPGRAGSFKTPSANCGPSTPNWRRPPGAGACPGRERPHPAPLGEAHDRVARLKDNLPELRAAAQKRFDSQPPSLSFQEGQDRVEVWDAEDFDPRVSLRWPTVRALRYRQRKPSSEVIEAWWLTNFSARRVGSRCSHPPCNPPAGNPLRENAPVWLIACNRARQTTFRGSEICPPAKVPQRPADKRPVAAGRAT